MANENAVVQFGVFGRTLTVSPGRAEFNRLRSRFIALAREQETLARESIRQFAAEPERLLGNGLAWASPYFFKASELAVEELMQRGCFDLDAETYLKTVFDRSPWDRCCQKAFGEYAAIVDAERRRESERAARTESAGDSWAGGGFGLGGAIKGAVQAEVLNLASAGISEVCNSIGRKQSRKENAEKIRKIFEQRNEEIVQGVFLAIAEGADTLLKCFNERGIEILGTVSAAEAGKAERMFNNLKSGKVPDAMVVNVKMEILEANPYCRDFYEWEYVTQGDASGELEKVADYFGISLDSQKKDAFNARLGDCSWENEEEVKAYRARTLAVAEEMRFDPVEKLAEIDARLEDLDRQARTAGGRLFDDRETAAKQRELCALEETLDLSTEESAIQGRQALLDNAARLGVDFSWKMDRVEAALNRFEEEARTVEGRVFETRDIAARQRILSEFESGLDTSSESAALTSKRALEDKISELGIDGEWKRGRIATAVSRFEREACTAFGRTYATREDACAAKGNRERFFEAVVIAAQQCGHRSVLSGTGISPKKATGAVQHLGVVPGEQLFVLIDTSLFGNVKTGLAVTSIGLRLRNGSVPTVRNFISWSDLAKIPQLPGTSGKSVDFGGGMLFENGGLMSAPLNVLLGLFQRVVGFSREATCLG